MSFDEQCRALDAGLFAVGNVHDVHFKFSTFCPARVHAHQHPRPILALGTARAGVDFEIGIVLIGFAG